MHRQNRHYADVDECAQKRSVLSQLSSKDTPTSQHDFSAAWVIARDLKAKHIEVARRRCKQGQSELCHHVINTILNKAVKEW